jgi:opacity protein-like surface antigen
MKYRCFAWTYSGVLTHTLLPASLLLALSVSNAYNAYSEMYIGGQIGTSIAGNSLTDVELTDFSPSGATSDRDLSQSILLGGKIGYYFPQAPWFGVETEVFYTTPHIKQENVQFTIPPGAIIPGLGAVPGGTVEDIIKGDHFRVVTWAPVNLIFRYHKMRLQPYVGMGLGLFFARVNTPAFGFEASQSAMGVGLNLKTGLEFQITRNLSAFGEWKYNRTSFSFDPNRVGAFGFDADYQVHFVTAGLNVHF